MPVSAPSFMARHFEKHRKTMHSVDFRKVVKNERKILLLVRNHAELQHMYRSTMLALSLVRHYLKGDYIDCRRGSASALAFALLYVLSPFDLAPDFIPFMGLLDDAALLGHCFTCMSSDLRKFNNWQRAQASAGKAPEELDIRTLPSHRFH